MMNTIEPIGLYLEPVRKSVTVGLSAEQAFRLFTDGIADWWPAERYSVSQARTRGVVLEPRAGGAVYEVRDDGETFSWGKVLQWDPPRRLVLSWHPGREPEVAQEVEITFTVTDEGTRVDLEHRNWRALGTEAEAVRDRYAGGWAEVLGKRFVQACDAQSANPARVRP